MCVLWPAVAVQPGLPPLASTAPLTALLSLSLGPRSDYLKRLKGAQRPLVIVGPGVLQRDDRDAVLQKVGGSMHAACEVVGGIGLSSISGQLAVTLDEGPTSIRPGSSCRRMSKPGPCLPPPTLACPLPPCSLCPGAQGG